MRKRSANRENIWTKFSPFDIIGVTSLMSNGEKFVQMFSDVISELSLDVDVTVIHFATGVVAAGLVNGHVILHDLYNSNNTKNSRNDASIMNNYSRSSSLSPSKSLTTHLHHASQKKMRDHSSSVTAVHVDVCRRVFASASHEM